MSHDTGWLADWLAYVIHLLNRFNVKRGCRDC